MSADKSAQARAESWLARLEAAVNKSDAVAGAALFHEDGFWRDLLALTWNIITFEGRPAIQAMLAAQAKDAAPIKFAFVSADETSDGIVEAWYDFETALTRGRGHLRLKGDRAWTLLTAANELKGFEEPVNRRRIEGVHHVAEKGRKSWIDLREEEERDLGYSRQPYCLIVGAGQGGLALAARLKVMGVPTLVVDALARPGDAWRSRYRSLYLHDPIWVNHLPYIAFPDHWPVYTHKDKMGQWLESYAQMMEINFWGNSPVERAEYDETEKVWRVTVRREGKLVELRPKQLVFATGLSGMKNTPIFPGMDKFKGKQFHSSDHPGAAAYANKRVVVVGANNSAHDIAVDLWGHGCDVTMIQRSPTVVIRGPTMRHYAEIGPYSEAGRAKGIDWDTADLMGASLPFKVREEMERAKVKEIKERDADLYERLEKSGFMVTFGHEETGLSMQYMHTASGYYIDVGGSELVANGQIKVKTNVGVDAIEDAGVRLSSGELLPADVIVYATGYGPMEDWARELISPEAAEKIGHVWGLGSGARGDPGPWEGELRNMWKPTALEGVWFHGGNLQQSRFHSMHVALQIKARMENLPIRVYRGS